MLFCHCKALDVCSCLFIHSFVCLRELYKVVDVVVVDCLLFSLLFSQSKEYGFIGPSY